jgi:hypothetical protein
MSWQPIETAPKDGSEIDLWISDPRYPDGYRIPECAWMDGRWVSTLEDQRLESKQAPTHWMPLPEPPSASLHPCPRCGKKQPMGDKCVECGLEIKDAK